MSPTDLYEELASIAMGVIKRPYFRHEPVTYEEFDALAEKLYEFILREKARIYGEHTGNQETERKSNSERASKHTST